MRSSQLEEMLSDKEEELEWVNDHGSEQMSASQVAEYRHKLQTEVNDLRYEIEEG